MIAPRSRWLGSARTPLHAVYGTGGHTVPELAMARLGAHAPLHAVYGTGHTVPKSR